jgi:hypothetical protein
MSSTGSFGNKTDPKIPTNTKTTPNPSAILSFGSLKLKAQVAPTQSIWNRINDNGGTSMFQTGQGSTSSSTWGTSSKDQPPQGYQDSGFSFTPKKDTTEDGEQTSDDLNLFYHGFDHVEEESKVEGKPTIVTPVSMLKKYFKNKALSDMTLKVKDMTFPAHKFILCARSKVWETLITGPWAESGKNILEIENVSVEAFETFLYHIYTFETRLPPGGFDVMLEVADLALQHDCPALALFVAENVENCLSEENVCDAIQTIHDIGNPELENACWSYFFANSQDVMETEGFGRMTIETLQNMLKNDILPLDEVEVFSMLMAYAKRKKDLGTPAEVLKALVPLVRFPLMSVEDLTNVVEPTKLLSSEELLQTILHVVSNGLTGKPVFSIKNRVEGQFVSKGKIQWNVVPKDMIVSGKNSSMVTQKVPQNLHGGWGNSSVPTSSTPIAYASRVFNAGDRDQYITIQVKFVTMMAIGLLSPSIVDSMQFAFHTLLGLGNSNFFTSTGTTNQVIHPPKQVVNNYPSNPPLNQGPINVNGLPTWRSGDILTLHIGTKTGEFRMKLGNMKDKSDDWKWTMKVEYPLCLSVYLDHDGDSCEILSGGSGNLPGSGQYRGSTGFVPFVWN